MDELVNLHLIEQLENAEDYVIDGEVNEQIIVRNPMNELSDEQFRKLFRVNKELFEFIVNMLLPFMRPKLRTTDLDVPLRILAVLRFLATGSYQLDIGSNWFLGMSQPSISRCLHEVINAMNRPEIFNTWVHFPNTREALNNSRRRFFETHDFPGIIGLIDCTHVAIFPPHVDDPQQPEHVYVNRKQYHSINVQLICDADTKIINVNARYPGSTHDAYIWNNSNIQRNLQQLHDDGHNDYFLLGDSGYPLRSYLLTPITPEPIQDTPQYFYNKAHKNIRSKIERCNGILKMRFRCLLKHRVLHYDPTTAGKIINTCVILHNLCVEYNIEEPEDDLDEDLDLGLYEHNEVDGDEVNAARHANPAYAEGLNARNKIIRQLFN